MSPDRKESIGREVRDPVWELAGRARTFREDPMGPVEGEFLRKRAEEEGARSPHPLRWWLTAASLAALALAGTFALLTVRADGPATVHASTGPGEVVTVELAEGAVARLGPGSQLRATHTEEGTEAILEGRAYFAVAPSANGAFQVVTPLGEARVLGTRFEVVAEPIRVRITVIQGRVSIIGPGISGSVEVSRRERGHLLPGGSVTLDGVEGPREGLEWMGNFFAFQSTPLGEVVDEMSGHFRRPIRVEERTLERETVTATFTDQGFEEVVQTLCRILGTACSVTAEGAVIGRGAEI